MSKTLTVECQLHFDRRGPGRRKEVAAGPAPTPVMCEPGRVPRVAKLMALALRFERLVRTGAVKDYAALARVGHVTRARMTRIMNLVQLAPDIQEHLLFLPRVQWGKDPVILAQMQPIAKTLEWKKQRKMWAMVVGGRA